MGFSRQEWVAIAFSMNLGKLQEIARYREAWSAAVHGVTKNRTWLTLQYCSDFCHTLTWISHGFTCVPHPEPASHLPPHPIPLGHPSALSLSTCLMYPTWTGDLFHAWQYTCFDAVPSDHLTLAFSHRVQKSVLYICLSFSVLHIGLSLPSF